MSVRTYLSTFISCTFETAGSRSLNLSDRTTVEVCSTTHRLVQVQRTWPKTTALVQQCLLPHVSQVQQHGPVDRTFVLDPVPPPTPSLVHHALHNLKINFSAISLITHASLKIAAHAFKRMLTNDHRREASRPTDCDSPLLGFSCRSGQIVHLYPPLTALMCTTIDTTITVYDRSSPSPAAQCLMCQHNNFHRTSPSPSASHTSLLSSPSPPIASTSIPFSMSLGQIRSVIRQLGDAGAHNYKLYSVHP